jgi:predicted MPP superfamily phosphohydrolase
MKAPVRTRWCLLLLTALLCAAAVIHSIYLSTYHLQTSYYTIASHKLTAPVRLVLLSDLHNSSFGPNNEQLLTAVSAESPDLILMTGDMLNSHQSDTTLLTDLIRQLSQTAPVYCSYGNHEMEHETLWGTDLSALSEQAGATMLNFNFLDLEMKGQSLRVGGIYAFCLPEKFLKTGEARPNECDFLNHFQNTDRCTLLMCHMPVAWLINDGLDDWNVDFILSGHAHGGQIRLPLLGGLYAPDQGWFPGRMCGIYSSMDSLSTLILSRGLGSSSKTPRFNNLPEIVVIDLLPQ